MQVKNVDTFAPYPLQRCRLLSGVKSFNPFKMGHTADKQNTLVAPG